MEGAEDVKPSSGPVLREILPKCGLVVSEKGNLSEVSELQAVRCIVLSCQPQLPAFWGTRQ